MSQSSANRVAVVIPMWNSEKFGRDALDAVARQTRAPNKLVVVDDGSTDGTVEMVREWMAQHPEINTQLIQQNNYGPGHARNTGLRAVGDVDFLIFIDSDDEIRANFLKITTAALAANDDAVLAVTNVWRYAGKGDLPESANSEAWDNGVPIYYNTRILCAWPHREQLVEGSGFLSCALLRAKDVKAIGGFDERLYTGQDTRFFFRLGERGRFLHVDEYAVSVYRGKKTSLSQNCDDAPRRWALLFEHELTRSERLKVWQVWKKEVRLLGERWASAGRIFERRCQIRDAFYCYFFALMRNPISIRIARQALAIFPRGLFKLWAMSPALIGGAVRETAVARREDD